MAGLEKSPRIRGRMGLATLHVTYQNPRELDSRPNVGTLLLIEVPVFMATSWKHCRVRTALDS